MFIKNIFFYNSYGNIINENNWFCCIIYSDIIYLDIKSSFGKINCKAGK